jgi:enhancer of polycomb-like protein
VTPKAKLDIPVPHINTVETYERDVPATYKVPRSFVRYHRSSAEEWNIKQEYFSDVEDEIWLKNNTKFGGACQSVDASDETGPLQRRPQLPLALFERKLDILEKATGFEAIVTAQKAEVLIHADIPQLYQMFPGKSRPGVITAKQVIHEVYTYWLQKRSKLKRPLLRRYWPVTSTDDTNPHLVFRPREKEKYKLRKKRQNDMDAYRKMKQLRNDFDNLRAILDLTVRREQLGCNHVKLQVDLFQQRLHDAVDTSKYPRLSDQIQGDELKRVLDVPVYFDVHQGGRKAKRIRTTGRESLPPSPARASMTGSTGDNGTGTKAAPVVVAGRNHGEPAPLFVHPLSTRETYATSWEGAVPHVTTYIDSHAVPTFRFRHRPRVGRGGRLCIDRVPRPPNLLVAPHTVFRAGFAMPRSVKPKERLLDLLPRPIDHDAASRKIEDLCIAAIREDFEAKASAGGDAEENDGDEVIVSLDDWLETDDQLWGEERFAIGPF